MDTYISVGLYKSPLIFGQLQGVTPPAPVEKRVFFVRLRQWKNVQKFKLLVAPNSAKTYAKEFLVPPELRHSGKTCEILTLNLAKTAPIL